MPNLEYIDNIEFLQSQKPFKLLPTRLYNSETLYCGFRPDDPSTFETCYDTKVYNHYISHQKESRDVGESLARSLHDHYITYELHNLLDLYNERRVVGVMGGHQRLRTDAMYRQIVFLSKRLTESGRLMVTGGGPGAMEATHLGAWMAGRTDSEVEDALSMLSVSPSFKDEGWLASSFRVMEKYPQQDGFRSLSIPTWYYGHEPSAPFATDIAKYFDNSVREDGIVTVAKGGIIYTPGSAGTLQEIFQDTAQNHYLSVGFSSPMIFLGKDFFTRQIPVYPFLESLAIDGRLNNLLLTITDSSDEVIDALHRFFED